MLVDVDDTIASHDSHRCVCHWGFQARRPRSGAYCRARAKLPDHVLETLTVQVADELEERVPEAWPWHGRHVVNVDGTTVMAPDTPGHQKACLGQPGRKPGLGFPILRQGALTSLATGAIRGLAFGPYEGKESGETALLRSMLDRLNAGDVLLGDSYFRSYFMIALLQDRNAEIDFRSIKVHMNMENLRGQSPEIVRKELWGHCPAYNLIRKTPAQAAVMHDQTVRTTGFAGALQGVAGMMMQSGTVNQNLFLDLAKNKMESIASRRVGHRPNRVEP